MKALMFGWEFPPHILGGLGTASYGQLVAHGRHLVEDLPADAQRKILAENALKVYWE